MTNARTARSAREKAAQLRAEAERQAARKRALVAGILVIVVIALAVAAVVGIRTLQTQAREREAAAQAPPANLYTPPRSAVGGGMLVGQPGAKVTVEVYEDFLCPNCKSFEQANGALLRKYATDGKISLVYRPVSILDRLSSTQYSTRAASAMAAVINSSPAAAVAFHDALFASQPPENSPGLDDATLLDLAAKAGANRSAIEADVTGKRFEGWVTTTTEKFVKAYPPGGTPTAVVNGKRVENPGPQQLTAAIEAALKA